MSASGHCKPPERRGDVGLQLMGRERVEEGVAIKFVVAFDADFQCAIAHRAGDTQQNIAIVDLAIVQRHLPALIHFASGQFGRTGDAAAVFAAIGQIDTLFAQSVQQRTAGVDLIGRIIAVDDCDCAGFAHSQMSLVQSPPG